MVAIFVGYSLLYCRFVPSPLGFRLPSARPTAIEASPRSIRPAGTAGESVQGSAPHQGGGINMGVPLKI